MKPKLQVRRMREEDLDEVLNLLERAHREMDFAGIGLSFDSWSTRSTLQNPGAVVLVCQGQDQLLGVGGMAIFPSFFNYTERIAAEAVWHSDPSLPQITRFRIMAALLLGLERAAKEEGVQSVRFNPPPGACGEGLRRLLAGMGYRPTQVAMIKACGT